MTPPPPIAPARPSDLLRRPQRFEECALCRSRFTKAQPRTADHVIPSAFFNDPPPNNLPTWGVCSLCQKELSPREERLRNLFVAAHSRHPHEIVSVTERAKRSKQQPLRERMDYAATDSGLFVRVPIAVPDQKDLDAVFRKMAWGLFTWKHNRLPPLSCPIVVRHMSADAFDFWSDALDLPVQWFGPEVAWKSVSDEQMNIGVWLFMLHGAVPVGVWCGDAVFNPNIPPASAIALRPDR